MRKETIADSLKYIESALKASMPGNGEYGLNQNALSRLQNVRNTLGEKKLSRAIRTTPKKVKNRPGSVFE